MNRDLFRRPLRIGLPWLMWLALLLPLAQAAAAWHEVSHTAESAGTLDAGKKALHLGACGLCLASAAVHGAGVAPALPAMLHPALAQSQPPLPAPSWRPAAPVLGYRSRAPPSTPC
ncbi:hypothetical protein [Ideonella sp.]|uniref:hypothetical protein n=1 Tax=Ideonella sp. TaxID=1929293 RepID=UPI002B4A20C4|nr:hypothetical protein [Ideonella sp.]HJV71216.1 hypothetical protein [Ideonella sp.]